MNSSKLALISIAGALSCAIAAAVVVHNIVNGYGTVSNYILVAVNCVFMLANLIYLRKIK